MSDVRAEKLASIPPREQPGAEAKVEPKQEAEPKKEVAPEPKDTRAEELAKQARLHSLERMRLANRQKAIQESEAKLKEREAGLQNQLQHVAQAKTNPDKFLRAVYGDNWREFISQYQVNGNPPVEVAVEAATKAADEKLSALRKEFSDYKAEQDRKTKERDDAEAKRAKEDAEAEYIRHAKANANSYPLIAKWGAEIEILKEVEHNFLKTTKRDDITGEVVPGELLDPKVACEIVEKRLRSLYEAAKEVDKSAATMPVQEQNKNQATTPQSKEAPQRRSLSTDVSAFSVNGQKSNGQSPSDYLTRAEAAVQESLRSRGRL